MRGILRNRVVYLGLFLALFVLVLTLLGTAMMRMAQRAQETAMAQGMAERTAASLFGLWTSCSTMIGLFLGASAISAETKAGTLVTVLAKPVERWVFLMGKWIGVQLFLAAFVSFGTALGLAHVSYLGLEPSGVFWLGLLQVFVTVMLWSSLALFLSTLTSPVVAGATSFSLMVLPRLTEGLWDHPFFLLRWPVRILYYVVPADVPGYLVARGLGSATLLDPSYGLYASVTLENLLYALMVTVAACLIFSRRELRLR